MDLITSVSTELLRRKGPLSQGFYTSGIDYALSLGAVPSKRLLLDRKLPGHSVSALPLRRSRYRDHELIRVVDACAKETETQQNWLTTRLKAAAPQALLVAD
jgi:hypothetical protein